MPTNCLNIKNMRTNRLETMLDDRRKEQVAHFNQNSMRMITENLKYYADAAAQV